MPWLALLPNGQGSHGAKLTVVHDKASGNVLYVGDGRDMATIDGFYEEWQDDLWAVRSSRVSKASKSLDEAVQAFRERKFGAMQVVWLDAQYQKVLKDGQVSDRAFLVAVGLNENGQREILGIDTASSEAETNWRQFMESLARRGLTGIKLIISDDHAGLRKARQAVFPSIPWQRSIFHMAKNAQNKVPRNDMRKEIADTMRRIYGQETIEQASGCSANGAERRMDQWKSIPKPQSYGETEEMNLQK